MKGRKTELGGRKGKGKVCDGSSGASRNLLIMLASYTKTNNNKGVTDTVAASTNFLV